MSVGTGPTVHAVQRLRVISETRANFCVDQTSAPGLASFTAVPAKEGSIEFPAGQYETINPATLVQYRWDYPKKILGKKKPVTLKFTMPLAPTGTAATDGVAQVQGCLGLLLKASMGGESLGTGTRAVAGWTSSAGDVDAGEGASLPTGNATAAIDSSSVYHAREIEQRATDTITLKRALPFTPANGATLLGSATYYLTSDPDTQLQFVVEGLEQQDRWLLLGCQMTSISISLPIADENAMPEITFTFDSTTWLYGDDCATPITGSDLALSTYSNFNPIAGYAGRLLVQTVGTATYTGSTIDASTVTFEPKWKFQRVPSPSGVMATLQWMASRDGNPCVEGSFGTYFSNFNHFDWRDNRTDLAVAYQIGTAAGGLVLITAPTVQVVDTMRENSNGIANETVKWVARKDAETVGAANDIGYSPFRIHLL